MGRTIGVTLAASCLILAYIAQAQQGSFDVRTFGAKPDAGDIGQALLSAWKQACASTTPSTIVIPQGNFVLNQAKLEGPCKGPIELRVEGTLKAPADPSQFKEGEWVTVNNMDHFTISGGGTFDGQGSQAWSTNDCHKTDLCNKLPNSLSFNFLTNSIVRDVTSLNSKLFHVNIYGCKNFTFINFTIDAPENSPNTDGIHVGHSNGVNITDSTIRTGDDCVSIGDGSEQVSITNVTCGPGHGISVGSLGKYNNEEPVVGIFVRNCTIMGTMNGVRVKTWPASPDGIAREMHFEDIIMQNVSNPILIDQVYCPHNQCKQDFPSRVKISEVSLKNIRGTSSTPDAVKLLCSSSFPCQNVEVGDIDLTYTGNQGPIFSNCTNVKPTFTGKQNPPICTTPAQSS